LLNDSPAIRKGAEKGVARMTLSTEPIGSIPRPPRLLAALAATGGSEPALVPLFAEAVRDTIAHFEATGSPVITDGKTDHMRVLRILRDHRKPHHRVFVGVINPIDPRVETPEEVRDRVLDAARVLPPGQLGTCDDCGFSPFCDDTTTSPDTAFDKIWTRVAGTALASAILGGEGR
jgi:methionine synthase II (cobalamin-independent)